MQSNTITLPVDIANDGTIVSQDYLRHEEYLNRSVYIGASHGFSSRDLMTLYRTPPTRSGNFFGVSKTSIKFTQDVIVPAVDGTDYTSAIILDFTASVPVGASIASKTELRQRLLAILDNDEVMNTLWDRQSI